MSTEPAEPGVLYIVATPIGNLGDVTRRAVEILRAVDLIAAEDTRHTSILLRHLAINRELVSLHEHNESRRAPSLVERMERGDSVALVSDAGTPLVSDPGFRLVALAHEAGIRVSPVPGPSALLAALSSCGLPAPRFTFEGFLPAAAAARRAALSALSAEPRAMVFYESPRRVAAALGDMAAVFGGGRQASLCRELTKTYETIRTGTIDELVRWLETNEEQRRGEFVVVVAGHAGETADAPRPEWVAAVRELREVMPLKRAAHLVAGITGARSQLLYRLAQSEDGREPRQTGARSRSRR